MDSPSDLSPNAPPAGFDDSFKNLSENSSNSQHGPASTEGSVDSSGFEKVEHDVLEEYGNNFNKQMQQSNYGQLPDDPDNDDDFVVIPSNSMEGEYPGVVPLTRIPAEIDKPYPSNLEDEIAPRHQDTQESKESTPSPAPRSTGSFDRQHEGHEHSPKEDHHVLDQLDQAMHSHHESKHSDHSEKEESPQPVTVHLEEYLHKESEHQSAAVYNPYADEEDETSHDESCEQHIHESEPHSHDTHDYDEVADENTEEIKQHHDIHQMDHTSEDLIEVPSTDPHDLDYHHAPRDSPLIPEPMSYHSEPQHTQPEAYLPKPEHHDYSYDLLDIGQQAKELVEEAVLEAGDKIHQSDEATRDPIHHLGDEVQKHVDSVHNEVDGLLESMNENDDFQEEVKSNTKESDEEPAPDFRRTPEPEETTYERHGPLTIPELPDQQEDELLEDLEPSPPNYNQFGHRHGFETEARPPTPPKDISDEDFKPSLVNLGHGHYPTHSHADCHHSILKHSPTNTEPWIDFKTVDPCILDLVYWRDPKRSGIALALSLLAVFVLAKYPLLSIIAYTGVAVLAGTLGFRIFKAIEAQIKKTGGENPFQEYLNKDLAVPQDKVHAQADVFTEHAASILNKAKKLIFVENIVDSVKFVLLLWSLTYVSAWFSGFALVIITVLGVFTIPKVYETYQEPIDQQIAVISGHINNVVQIVEEKLPFLKRAAADAEKKEQ